MSLCIAAAVPDGIVFASDTLQSIFGLRTGAMDVVCGNCHSQSRVTINSPVSVGTFPTAQKQHHMKIPDGSGGHWSLGVLNAGNLNVGNKRVSQLIREFERSVNPTETVDRIAERMAQEFEKTLIDSLRLKSVEEYSGEPIHLALCGYDHNDSAFLLPKKFVISIGKKISIQAYPGYGAVWVGRVEIPALFNDGNYMKQRGLESINLLFEAMNIQDAIDYNRFLINTAIGYQKFSPGASDVGGEIEVGVICRGKEYFWVKRMAWR